MSKKKDEERAAAERADERDLQRTMARTDVAKRALAVLPHLVWAPCLAFGVWAIAGEHTTFTAFVDAAINVDFSKWAALGLSAILGGGWAVTQKLRKRETAELSEQVKTYEKQLHPERTSSGLNRHGERDPKTVDAEVKRLKSGDEP